MELLSVIVIIGILLSAISMALSKARELARRTRAEAELREMVSAWLQYHQLYGGYPSLVSGKNEIETSRTILAPLIDPESDDNPRGLVLLNPKLPFNAGDFYTDPWGTPYQLSFAQAEVKATTAMRTSIAFPSRQRRFP
jgi:type II secretory pathway pseudopilin PulG